MLKCYINYCVFVVLRHPQPVFLTSRKCLLLIFNFILICIMHDDQDVIRYYLLQTSCKLFPLCCCSIVSAAAGGVGDVAGGLCEPEFL